MPKYDLSDKNKYPDIPGILGFKPDPDDYPQLGELIIKIALGMINVPMNATSDELRAILRTNGVKVPDGVNVQFIQRQPKTLVVMIPPKDMLVAALRAYQEMDSKKTTDYRLPPGYDSMILKKWDKTIEEFYEIRVADYTLSYCR